MKIKHLITTGLAVFTLLFAVAAQSGWWPFSSNDESVEIQGDIVEVEWDDLIPDDFVQPENPFYTMSQEEVDKLLDGSEESQAELARIEKEFNYAPVVNDLDGKRVSILAYVTPLEYNEDSMASEFLLVPYVGACIHTPPPPANQIVHAKMRESIKLNSMYDPVNAIGILRAETTKSDLAESGYKLEVEKILPYEAPK